MYSHTAACRIRMEAALEQAGDQRVDAARRRYAERIVAEGGDPDRPVLPSAPEEPVAAEAPWTAAAAAAGPDLPTQFRKTNARG